MTCFSCFKCHSQEEDDNNNNNCHGHGKGRRKTYNKDVNVVTDGKSVDIVRGKGAALSNPRANVARSFTFRELAASTQNFRAANLIGEGGFGSVYKGRLESGKLVAVKKLNLNGSQGNQEFIVESRPFLKDRKKFVQLADPLLQDRFPARCMHHVVAIIAMCLQEQANFRPLIGDIVVALEYLASQAELSENPKASTFVSHPSPSKKDNGNIAPARR
ncbi:hypothetical protein M8C21_030945, partial [Ambrosia artemisiifolia]